MQNPGKRSLRQAPASRAPYAAGGGGGRWNRRLTGLGSPIRLQLGKLSDLRRRSAASTIRRSFSYASSMVGGSPASGANPQSGFNAMRSTPTIFAPAAARFSICSTDCSRSPAHRRPPCRAPNRRAVADSAPAACHFLLRADRAPPAAEAKSRSAACSTLAIARCVPFSCSVQLGEPSPVRGRLKRPAPACHKPAPHGARLARFSRGICAAIGYAISSSEILPPD